MQLLTTVPRDPATLRLSPCRAAHEAAVERETAAVVATGTKLQARRHAGPHAARAQRGTEDEEEEWQDDDKLN